MDLKQTVVVVGIGGIFPDAPDLNKFWNIISNRVNTSRVVPEGRWPVSVDKAYSAIKGEKDKVYSQKACFVDTCNLDPSGLNISHSFLEDLDPLFHLLLYAGREAFGDAVTTPLDLTKVGVTIGNIALPTDKSSQLAMEYLGVPFGSKILMPKILTNQKKKVNPINRYVAGLPGGVLAKALNLGGGSVTLDAACASSLYALSLAVQELQSGRADAMLTGGVSRPDCFYTQMGFSQLHALSPDGVSSPFDEKGNGLVVGEGSGILVLKRLDDALKHGDTIYAVIKGTGLSNDVDGSLLAPDTEGQLRAMEKAYRMAGWSPSDVDLIECHATGTPVGDAVEFKTLMTLWEKERWDAGQCVLTSVKSNIGHLLTASGSAGLIKVLLALKHKKLPPTANFSNPGSAIDLQTTPFTVLESEKTWDRREKDIPLRAGVSGFGFGGINAHILLEEWAPDIHKKQNGTTTHTQKDNAKFRNTIQNSSLAIVGMETHIGPWKSLKHFQERVLGGRNHESAITRNGWYGGHGTELESLKGFFVENITVPFNQYRIPPKELEEMLPQQLLMLEVASGAIADAKMNDKSLKETGVFIGIGLDLNTTNFHIRWMMEEKGSEWAKILGLDLGKKELSQWVNYLRNITTPSLTANRTFGALGSIVASRIAREFRLGGPCFTLSSEESSGLKAFEVACRQLQSGQIFQAVVGAVDLGADIRSVIGSHGKRKFSFSGESLPFMSESEGSVLGEGAVCIVLKRLQDAEKDGDRIYSIIKGVGSSSGGNIQEQLPEKDTYLQALGRAYKDAAVDPSTIGLIEAHGSGLVQEDEIEEEALTGFFPSDKDQADKYAITSAKPHVGHTGAASGLASLIKASLSLYQKVIPGFKGAESPNKTSFENRQSFFYPSSSQYWFRNSEDGPRRAGVSGFSMDGNCVHVVLEECENKANYIQQEKRDPLGSCGEGLFVVEGNTATELEKNRDLLRSFLKTHNEKDIAFIAARWWQENPPDPNEKTALSFVAGSKDEALDILAEAGKKRNGTGKGKEFFLSGNNNSFFVTQTPKEKDHKIAFVYPGSGCQYPGMGKSLSVQWPEIFENQDRENRFLKKQFVPGEFWNNSNVTEEQVDSQAALLSQVTYGSLLTDLVKSFNITPSAVIGYSLGETSGLISVKAWRERDEMLQRIMVSPLFTEELAGSFNAAKKIWKSKKSETVDWVVGIVNSPDYRVREVLKNKKRVYLLIVNTDEECVIGGDAKRINAVVKELACYFFPLKGLTAAHCEVVAPVQKAYRDLHLFNISPVDGVDIYSGCTGLSYSLSKESAADSILGHALHGINYPKLIRKAYEDGVRLFLEMGPGSSCTRMIRQILKGKPHLAISASQATEKETSVFLRFLSKLIAERVPVNLKPLYGPEVVRVKENVESSKREKREALTIPVGGRPFQLPEIPGKGIKKINPAKINYPDNKAIVSTTPRNGNGRQAHNAKEGLMATVEQMTAVNNATSEAHGTFLNFSNNSAKAMEKNISRQIALVGSVGGGGEEAVSFTDTPSTPTDLVKAVALDRDQCMEFAIGKISNVLGDDFAQIDSHPTRVRLPDEPLMLVDRILSIHGEAKSLKHGKVVTEHNILENAWYLDCGRIPVCIAVEAGQADLFLSGYLGIDFQTKGNAVYRLLDAVVTFHDSMPGVGDVINYDISIDNFFRQGDTYLFRFNFDATVNGKLFLTMRDGCAGFFTQEELDAGKGIIESGLQKNQFVEQDQESIEELVPVGVESYTEEQVDVLRKGDMAGCFGNLFGIFQGKTPVGIPGGRMKLVDRVTKLDPKGGRYKMGLIRAEADIHPDDWFLTCHFVDDRVMPGTLMYECCMHTLRIFLLRIGWVGNKGEVCYEPVPGVASRLKCRGQVIDTTKVVTYEISIKKRAYGPEPFVIADALMYADGRPIVEISDMSVKLSGLSEEILKDKWKGKTKALEKKKEILYDNESILAFAVGKPSEAFGEPYKIFDENRIIARLPGPPYKVLDRITGVTGEPWKMKAGATVEGEYDIPADAWYFAAERSPYMPFAVLLEVGLQPCGWLAAYIGSALTSDTDLSFRNLGGTATQFALVTAETKTLTIHVKMTSVSQSAGMIIQHYTFEVVAGDQTVYKGTTYFGFFTKVALSQQVGIRDAKLYIPDDSEKEHASSFDYPTASPYPEKMLRMVDKVEMFSERGGDAKLGFIQGIKKVEPEEWFFKAHFYQDSVCPGSLGLESFLQLLKVASGKRWGGNKGTDHQWIIPLNHEHSWIYRGQIIPKDKEVTVQAVVKKIDDSTQTLFADGFLIVDGRVIYQMKDFSLQMLK